MFDFYLLYQPKIKAGEIVGLEALLRPVKTGKTLPEFFAEFKDKSALDLSVMKHCLQDVKRFNIQIPVSINIYPSSLLDDFFIFNVVKKLKGTKIYLELVEHEHIEVCEKLVRHVEILKKNNIKIAVDDFGKDFSKIDLVLALNVDEVKLDRALIENIDVNYSEFKHLSFVYAKLKNLCTDLIVFKGVENRRQLELIELFTEAPIVQGFYFYHPMKLDHIIKLKEFNNKIEIIEKAISTNETDLDYKLHQFLMSNGNLSTKSGDINVFFKDNDTLGLIYNEDVKVTLNNFRRLYFNDSSIIDNGVMAMIDSTEKLVVMRNEEGIVIYDNTAHKDLIGGSLIGISPQYIVEHNNAYRLCLEKDEQLNTDKNKMFLSDTELFDGIMFDTIREKMTYNNKNFIVTTICPTKSGLVDVSLDTLTQCYTRSFLTQYQGAYENCFIAFLDLNGFKTINDRFGHSAGDHCLIDFTCMLKSSLREQDVVVRYGGDEFVIIFESVSYENIESRLNALNAQVSNYFLQKGYALSFSFGLSEVENNDIDLAINVADINMYSAKQRFKCKTALYDSV